MQTHMNPHYRRITGAALPNPRNVEVDFREGRIPNTFKEACVYLEATMLKRWHPAAPPQGLIEIPRVPPEIRPPKGLGFIDLITIREWIIQQPISCHARDKNLDHPLPHYQMAVAEMVIHFQLTTRHHLGEHDADLRTQADLLVKALRFLAKGKQMRLNGASMTFANSLVQGRPDAVKTLQGYGLPVFLVGSTGWAVKMPNLQLWLTLLGLERLCPVPGASILFRSNSASGTSCDNAAIYRAFVSSQTLCKASSPNLLLSDARRLASTPRSLSPTVVPSPSLVAYQRHVRAHASLVAAPPHLAVDGASLPGNVPQQILSWLMSLLAALCVTLAG